MAVLKQRLAKKINWLQYWRLITTEATKELVYQNQINTFQNNTPDLSFNYFNKKYSKDILAGALANIHPAAWQQS